MTPARIAFLHLVRRKFSTSIVLLGIILAVATSGLLLRLYNLTNERFASLIHTGDAIVGAKSGSVDLLLGMLNFEGDYPDFIPMNLYNTLKTQETIRFEDKAEANSQFIQQIFPFLLFAKADRYRVYASSTDFFNFHGAEMPEMDQGTTPTTPNEIVVGASVADHLHVQVGDSLPARTWLTEEPSTVEAQKYKVDGVWKRTGHAWDRIALANWVTADKILAENPLLLRTPWGGKVLHFMLVYLKPGGFTPLQNLVNQRTVAQSISVSSGFEKLSELTGAGRELGLFVAIIILILGFSSVASMMMGRFDSTNVQLAVLRALGYSKKELAQVLIYEALYLALIACLLGACLDAATFPWLRELLGGNLPPEDIIPMSLWRSWPVWTAALCGNILAVLYPIWRISKQNIHMSLRNL
jgi:putative ABC transport system permease protein